MLIVYLSVCHLRILVSFDSFVAWVVNRELFLYSFFFVFSASNMLWFILAVTASCTNEKFVYVVRSLHDKGDRPAANDVDVFQDAPVFDDDII